VSVEEDILVELRAMRKALETLVKQGGNSAAASSSKASSSSAAAASDRELDSDRGDPTIKRMPPKWNGDDFTGYRYSETTSEFLESLAGFLNWKADRPQEGNEKYAAYDRKDASRALGWARRLRSGWQPASSGTARGASDSGNNYDDGYGGGDNDIPF
jgi:hypothetical protein